MLQGVTDVELACPRMVNDGRDILIPAGVSRGFNVSAANLPAPKVPQLDFISIQGRHKVGPTITEVQLSSTQTS